MRLLGAKRALFKEIRWRQLILIKAISGSKRRILGLRTSILGMLVFQNQQVGTARPHNRAHNRTLRGREVYDVHEKNFGYDINRLDLNPGELRLIEVTGLGAQTGTILLTPNEKRVVEDWRACYWLCIVTNCSHKPQLQEPVQDPVRYDWHEVSKVAHYYLSVDAMTQPMEVQENQSPYGDKDI